MNLPLCPVFRFPAPLGHQRAAASLAPQTTMMVERCHANVCLFTWTLRRSAGPAGLCHHVVTTPTTAKVPARSPWDKTWGRQTTLRCSPSSMPLNWPKALRRRAVFQTNSSALICCILMMMRMWFWSSMMIWWQVAAGVIDILISERFERTTGLDKIQTRLLWQDSPRWRRWVFLPNCKYV